MNNPDKNILLLSDLQILRGNLDNTSRECLMILKLLCHHMSILLVERPDFDTEDEFQRKKRVIGREMIDVMNLYQTRFSRLTIEALE